MSPDGTLIVDQLWKRFRADRGRALLKDHLSQSVDRLRGRGGQQRWRYALSDVSFRVDPGESIAIIGTNGSGKSTLLKILAGVMFPHAGSVETAGRVAAMIEVAAGIHPDLTGRENIALYGTILGLSRARIARQFDDIVAFGGLEQAIDRQVKFYSSGMKVRLGFAVNAFLEPDVLIVDEVLAVGDGAFQQRCLERMSEVINNGTTLVYVSHDLHTVESMCTRAVWLHNGVMRSDGPTRDVLPIYRSALSSGDDVHVESLHGLRRPSVTVSGDGGPGSVESNGAGTITVRLGADRTRRMNLVLGVSDGGPSPIFLARRDVTVEPAGSVVSVTIDPVPLAAGEYSVWLELSAADGGAGLGWHHGADFKITGPPLEAAPRGVVRPVPVQLPAHWRDVE